VQDGKGPLQPPGAAPFFIAYATAARANVAFATLPWLLITAIQKVNFLLTKES